MAITRLNPEYQERLATEGVSLKVSLPSGASGTIRATQRGGIVFVQMDGLTVPNTGWKEYASGLPQPKQSAWQQIITDQGAVVKANVDTGGVLHVRKTSSTTALADSCLVYPVA